MTLIPTVNETEEQRRYRLLSNQVDVLTHDVRELQANKGKPQAVELNERAEVPKVIAFAQDTMRIIQERIHPEIRRNPIDGHIETIGREPTRGEIDCLESACHLMQDYFDRHNSKLQDEREDAQEQREERRRLRQKAQEDQVEGNTEANKAKTEQAQRRKASRDKGKK